MELALDARARRLLDHHRPGQALLITIVNNYGLAGAALIADWCRAEHVERDPDLVCLGVQQGVPIYAHRRLAAYARWHALALTARSMGWWPSFAVVRGGEVWRDLVRWEHMHPGLCGHTPAA